MSRSLRSAAVRSGGSVLMYDAKRDDLNHAAVLS